MTRNDLYDLESAVYKNIDRIKREQEEYRKGVEYGIELMFKAVRKKLLEEEEQAVEKKKTRKGCSNCNRKNSDLCKTCVSTYDTVTNTSSPPSNWQPIPEPPKES